MIGSVLMSMERCCHKEHTVLGCRHQRSLGTSVSSPKTPLRHSDVDFHDVFGGPPRRSSTQGMRYSFGEGVDPYSLRGGEEGVSVCNPWTGLSEKPAFGEDAGNRRRYPSANFFDDIFGGDNSSNCSPRVHDRDPFSSSSSSLVLSPAQPLPPPQSAIFGSSYGPDELSVSPPSKLTRGMDFPSLGDLGASNGTSHSYSPSSRFSNQTIPGQDGLRNDAGRCFGKSQLSHEFSFAKEESPKLTTPNRTGMGSNLENGSNSSNLATNTSQSHFSLYKWASKGVPFVMPLRRVNSSRIKVKSKAERCSSTNGRIQSEGLIGELPAAIQHHPSTYDSIAPSTESFRIECEEEKNESFHAASTQDITEVHQIVEEAVVGLPEPERLNNFHSRVEEVTKREERKPYSLRETGLCGKTDKEISQLAQEARKTELKSLRSLLRDIDDKQGNDEITGKAGGKESMLETVKKSSVGVVLESVEHPEGKRNISDNTEVDIASLQHSPKNSANRLGRNGVNGKVREFVKIFNQEASSKSITNVETQSQSSGWKNSGSITAEKEPNVSRIETEDKMQTANANRKKLVPDASVMVDKNLRQQQKQHSGFRTSNRKSSDIASGQKESSVSRTASIPDGSKAALGDRKDSFQENFLIKELSQEQSKQAQIDEDCDEIQVSDVKIRQWLSGKEANIRSLLSTLQYVLWPESGWKPVPLVDIIEGSAVKRAYQKALLCLHPDKLQQKGVASHQKYIAQKVFDSLQEAWNHFNALGSF